MKTRLLLAALLYSTTLLAQEAVSPPLVTTSGTAEIQVVPDLADLAFEVEVRDTDLAAARKQQAERMSKVLAAMRAAGIPETDLKTSQIQLEANFPNDREGGQDLTKVRFYQVTQSIRLTVKEVQRVPEITAEAIQAGATRVFPVTLRTSQFRKYRDETRLKALRAAKEKAAALAAELGVQLGKPYSINEEPPSQVPRFSSGVNIVTSATATGEDGPAAFAPGTISVVAYVTAAFRLE